jgi:hypothetical protein
METFLEILKYTIPSLIVFLTAYFLLKLQLEDQQRALSQARRTEAMKITLPVRLQAYERLTLVCDRASVMNAMLRVRMPGMTVSDLRGALMLSISQEFDHNTSQQLYVSETLWRIIALAKEDTLNTVSNVAEGLDNESPDTILVDRLLKFVEEQGDATLLQKAIVAIRTEAGQLF